MFSASSSAFPVDPTRHSHLQGPIPVHSSSPSTDLSDDRFLSGSSSQRDLHASPFSLISTAGRHPVFCFGVLLTWATGSCLQPRLFLGTFRSSRDVLATISFPREFPQMSSSSHFLPLRPSACAHLARYRNNRGEVPLIFPTSTSCTFLGLMKSWMQRHPHPPGAGECPILPPYLLASSFCALFCFIVLLWKIGC